MPNPMVNQGLLNRVIAAVYWNDVPALNVTAPYLGTEGLSLSLDGEATTPIPTMTGRALSQEPYQGISLTMNLLKTQPLANAYKSRMELDSKLGDGQVYPDVPLGTGLSIYQINNCAIQNVRELRLNGTDAGWVVMITGYYNINSSLFST